VALIDTSYYAKFQTYLARNLTYLTERIAATTPIPPEESRRQAMHSLSYAFGEPSLWPLTRQLILTLAPKMEQAGHRQDWLLYLEQAIRLGEAQQDWAAAAECYRQQGILHRLVSDFPRAIDRLQRSVTRFQQIAADRDQARALNELAWVAYLQNQAAPATTYVEQALALLGPHDPERAMCYRVQGMVAIMLERWEEAEGLHRQALASFEAQGDQRKVAWSLQNLAYALRGQARYKEAIGYYEQAAANLQQQGDFYHWSIVQMNLGITYHYSGSTESAIDCFTAARTIPQSMLDPFHLARLSLNLAVAQMTLGQFPEAESAFLAAIQLYTISGAVAWQLNAMDGLAMTYIRWQKFGQAIQVLEQALTELPSTAEAPNHNYLDNSLHQHLEEALAAQRSSLNNGLPLV